VNVIDAPSAPFAPRIRRKPYAEAAASRRVAPIGFRGTFLRSTCTPQSVRSIAVIRNITTIAALGIAVLAPWAPPAAAQPGLRGTARVEVRPLDRFEQQIVRKAASDSALFRAVGSAMLARKTVYAGADGFRVPAYVFSPPDTTGRYPVIVLVHGGIHSDFGAHYATEVVSLVRLGYVVIAPEYRGSTGYGRAHYAAIDYGGKEVGRLSRGTTSSHTESPKPAGHARRDGGHKHPGAGRNDNESEA
jgi:hypothetical protein